MLDFYIFLGPGPEQVLQQYHAVIGLPAMVPYWSLGYHQCKWGYRTLGALQEVMEGYRQAGVPLEVIWSDIDYMDRYRWGGEWLGRRSCVICLQAAHAHLATPVQGCGAQQRMCRCSSSCAVASYGISRCQQVSAVRRTLAAIPPDRRP